MSKSATKEAPAPDVFEAPLVQSGWWVEFQPHRGGKWVPFLVIEVGSGSIAGLAYYPNLTAVGIEQAWHEDDPHIRGEAGVLRLQENATGLWRMTPAALLMQRADELNSLLDSAPGLLRLLNNRKPAPVAAE